MLRFVAALAACLIFTPALAADCLTWEDGQANAAAYVKKSGDQVAGVLLTPEETVATWAALFPDSSVPGPHRLGIHILASKPDSAYVAGFDPAGCVTGSAELPFGSVIDAMTKADVQSEFEAVVPEESADEQS